MPLLFARCFDSATWSTPYTRFFAFQVEGPGAGTLLRLSTVATVGCVLLLSTSAGGPGGPARRRWPWSGCSSVAAACLLIVPNKTLSPQYLLWIGGALAATRRDRAGRSGLLPRLNVLLLVACGLTQIIYPIGYGMLTGPNWSNAIGADAAGRPQRAARRDHGDRGPAGAAADPAGSRRDRDRDPPARPPGRRTSRWSPPC